MIMNRVAHKAVIGFYNRISECAAILFTFAEGLESNTNTIIEEEISSVGWSDTAESLLYSSKEAGLVVPTSGVWIWEGDCCMSGWGDDYEMRFETRLWREPTQYEWGLIMEGKNPFVEGEKPEEDWDREIYGPKLKL